MKRFDFLGLLLGLLLLHVHPTIAKCENPGNYIAQNISCTLPAPQNFQIASQSNNTITLKWNQVPGASQYRLNVTIGTVTQPPIATTDTSIVYVFPQEGIFDFSVQAVCVDGMPGAPSDHIVVEHHIIPIITIEEIAQRTPNCALLPSYLTKSTGEKDKFTLTMPSSGISKILYINVADWEVLKFTEIRFLLWLDASTQTLHYKTMAMMGNITRDPDCNNCTIMPSFLMFYSSNNPFFRINVDRTGNNFKIEIEYLKNVAVRFCDPEEFVVPGSGDRNEEDLALSSLDQTSLDLNITPNPATEWTTVSYHLPEAGPLKLSLVDSYGRQIQVLETQESAQPGLYEKQFSLETLQGGVYYIMLQSAGHRKVSAVMKL